jgi:RimJ/RimL family protein N-acetyltransferase
VPRFEIGYWVRKRFIGLGYITEAVAGLTSFAFKRLGAARIEIRMDERNRRSYRVAERLSFTFEGTLRHDARDVYGHLRNTRVYSMLRAEWLSRQPSAAPPG